VFHTDVAARKPIITDGTCYHQMTKTDMRYKMAFALYSTTPASVMHFVLFTLIANKTGFIIFCYKKRYSIL